MQQVSNSTITTAPTYNFLAGRKCFTFPEFSRYGFSNRNTVSWRRAEKNLHSLRFCLPCIQLQGFSARTERKTGQECSITWNIIIVIITIRKMGAYSMRSSHIDSLHRSYSDGWVEKPYDLMTINKISIGKWHLRFYTISSLIQIY